MVALLVRVLCRKHTFPKNLPMRVNKSTRPIQDRLAQPALLCRHGDKVKLSLGSSPYSMDSTGYSRDKLNCT